MIDINAITNEYYPKTLRRVGIAIPTQDVEDVTQEVFASLYQSIASFKGDSSFSSWFYSIVSARIADYYRKRSRTIPLFDSETNHAIAVPAWNDLEISDLIQQLPEQYRDVIWRRFYLGLSYVEIADEDSRTYQSVRSCGRRAIKYIGRQDLVERY